MNAVVLTYADRNSNGIHGKIELYNTHGDVIFIQFREKYKKNEDNCYSKPSISFS